MSASEGVVLALFWRREGADASKLPIRVECLSAPSEDLVAIGLMPHVPYDAVLWRIEYVVKGHCEFHNAKAGGEVAGIDRDLVDNVLSQFAAQLWQLVYAQFAEIGWRVYFAQ